MEGPSIVGEFSPLTNFVWNFSGPRKLLRSGSYTSFEILRTLLGVFPECYDELVVHVFKERQGIPHENPPFITFEGPSRLAVRRSITC